MEERPEPVREEESGISSPTHYNFPAGDIFQISDPGPEVQPPPQGPPKCRLDLSIFAPVKTNGGADTLIRVDVRKVWGDKGVHTVRIVVRERHIALDANLFQGPSGGLYGWSPLLMREEWREAYYTDPATNARTALAASEVINNCPRTALAQFTFPTSALAGRFIEIEAQAWCCEDDPRNFYSTRTHRGILVPSS